MSLVVSLTHTCFFFSRKVCQFGACFTMPYFNIPPDPFEAIGRHLKIKGGFNVACFEFAKMWSSQFLPKPHEIARIFMARATDDKHDRPPLPAPMLELDHHCHPLSMFNVLSAAFPTYTKHYSMPSKICRSGSGGRS